MEDKRDRLAEKMARLASVVERTRAEPRPRPQHSTGQNLQAAIELAEQFPQRARSELSYPILKRLLARSNRVAGGLVEKVVAIHEALTPSWALGESDERIRTMDRLAQAGRAFRT